MAAEALHGDPASWPATREYLRFIESGAMRGAAEKAEREKAAAPAKAGGEEP